MGSRAPGGDARGLPGKVGIQIPYCRFRQWITPIPASIRVSVSGGNAQRPYALICSHHVCSEPYDLRRLIGVRHIAIPAPRSSELSWTPGVTSGLQHVLLLNGGVSRPKPPKWELGVL